MVVNPRRVQNEKGTSSNRRSFYAKKGDDTIKDRILINKELIPYSFKILLADELFELEINHNESADLFTVTLSKDEEVIIRGEPIIYGVPLFRDVYDQAICPALDIVALDESNVETQVTWKNFGVTVFLYIEN